MAMIQQTKEFFQEVQMELRRVSFPTKQETLGATTVVIIFVIVISIFLALTDSGLARLVARMIG